MADLNALIAQGVQFQAPPDPFAQYAQMQQLQQGAQANQINRMKMDEARAATAERNALRQLNPSAPDYEEQLFRVNPTLGIAYRKEASTAAAQKATEDERLAAAAAARQGMLSQAQRDISSRPSDANITAHMEDVLSSPLFKPEEKASVQKLSQTLLAMPMEERGAFLAARGAKPSDLMVKPTPEQPDVAAMKALGYPLTQEGYRAFRDAQRQERLRTPEEEAQQIRIATASRPPRAEPTPAAPVAVVGEDGKVKYVSREEAIGKGMTPASAMEGLAPKEIQNREAKYPVAKRATTTVASTMTEIESTIDRLLANESGLNGITGFVGGRTFAVTDEARKAEADLKQLKNLAFVQGLTELRNASSTGAGVGNVSNKEGDRFENLKASLEQTQSTGDLIDSLKRLKSQSTSTKNAVNQAFEDTYAYRANAPTAAAPKPAPVAPNIDALLNKYK